MAVRWRLEFYSLFSRQGEDVLVRVDIEDSQYSGPIINKDGTGSPLSTQAGQPGGDIFERVLTSEVSLRLRSATGEFDDMFTSDPARFRIKVYVNGSLEWVYVPLSDLLDEVDVTSDSGDYFEFVIDGAGLGILKNIAPIEEVLTDSFYTRLDAIRLILGEYFDMNIVDGTMFYPEGVAPNQSALSRVRIRTERLEGMNGLEALDFLVPSGHQARMSRGKIFIVPVTEPTFVGYEYTPSGAYVGSTTYSGNYTSFRIGPPEDQRKRVHEVFDGVRRIYDPGEAPNLIDHGDFQSLEEDFHVYTNNPPTPPWGIESPQFPLTRVKDVIALGWPKGWTRTSGVDNSSGLPGIVRTGEGMNPLGWTMSMGQRAEFQTVSLPLNAGERLKIGGVVNGVTQSEMGTPVLVAQLEVSGMYLGMGPDGEYIWQEDPGAGDPDRIIKTWVPFDARGRVTFERITPPVPTTGSLYLRVRQPTAKLLFGNPFPDPTALGVEGLSVFDHVTLLGIYVDVVDEEGRIIRRSEELAGKDGNVYEYTEAFGDGFTYNTPGAMQYLPSSPLPGLPTVNWSLKGDGRLMPLAHLQTKYLHDQLNKPAEYITNRVLIWDLIDLFDGKRVNYIRTDWYNGYSEVETYEIQDHDLDAEVIDTRVSGSGSFGGRVPTPGGPDPFNRFTDFMAIGELNEDVPDENRGTIEVLTRSVIRAGFEYLIVNRGELKNDDPDAGVYPIIVERTDENGEVVDPESEGYDDAIATYDPGEFPLIIQEQRINAPAGSPIFLSPGQESAGIEFYEEQTIGLSRAVAGDSIGFLAAEVGSEGMPSPAEYTSLSLKDIPGDLDLRDGQLLKLVSPKGHQESVVVNGDQAITQGEDSISIQGKVFRHYYPPELSYVKESGYAISSRLNFVIKASEGNFQSIAEIATHVNIGGGEAYSALQLRSGIQTNEQGIATNVQSIAQLSTHVNLGGGQAFSAVALESRIGVNEQGIATNIQAIANMGTAITDLEADGRTVIRSVSEPTKRPSGADLEVGDLWLDSSIISAEFPIPKNELHVWNGSAWVPSDEQFRITQAGFTAFSQKVEDEYFSKAIMYAGNDGELGFVSVEGGPTPTVRIQGKYLEVDADTTFSGDVHIKGRLTATNWGGGGITEDGGIEMASSIGAVTSWQDVARAVKWKNEASGPGIFTGFIYSYFEYADQTDPEDSVLHLTAGLLEGDHTTRRGAGKIYLSAETHVTHNKEFYYKGQTLDQRFSSGASSWGDISGKPFNTIGSNLQVSSGALRVHSSSASNWDTAYQQRGSNIAGAGLTWSGGNLNVSLAVQNIPDLPASKITSGLLPVARGGTGRSSFDNDRLVFGNGSSGLSTTSAIRRDGNNIRANNFILN